MNTLEELLDGLSWYQPQEIQDDAIKSLLNIDDRNLKSLAQPGDKSCWENAAIVLEKIGFPRIKPIIPDLMRWLQDINWPGALRVFEIIKNIEVTILIPYIEASLIEAEGEEDYTWISWINMLVEELNINWNMFSDLKVYEILKLKDHD